MPRLEAAPFAEFGDFPGNLPSFSGIGNPVGILEGAELDFCFASSARGFLMKDKMKLLWIIFKSTLSRWWNDNTFRLSASLAFYTIFSMAPTLLIAVYIASLVFKENTARQQIAAELSSLLGPQGGRAAADILKNMSAIGGNLKAIAIGVFTLVIGSTAVFAELQSALNQIWGIQVKPDRSIIKGLIRDRLLSFAIVIAVGFLLLVSLVVSASLTAVQDFFTGYIPHISWFWRITNIITSFLIASLLFGAIYKYLPDVRISWKDVSVGAVSTAFLFTVGKFLIGFYLGQTAIASMYGAAGSFVVLLIWIYYSALICFFGAEFTQVYAHRYGSQICPQKHATFIAGKKSGCEDA